MVEYDVWRAMLARCGNPNNNSFARYGGRGIKVCEQWLAFENFLADMGRRPPHSALERIDNDKGYGPENCRWATMTEQARNKSDSRFVTYQGTRMALAEAAERSGVAYSVVHARIRLGWPEERWFIPQLFTTKRIK